MPDETKDSSGYDVGYGKPPKHGRFQPGKSGNPRGRPKGSRNLASVVLHEARKPVRVNGPRGQRTITKVEATVMQLANQSAQGDLAAQRQFLPLVRNSEEFLSLERALGSANESDQLVIENLMRRIRQFEPSEGATDPQSTKGETI
jgi:Family of unknown function (DUF5681)